MDVLLYQNPTEIELGYQNRSPDIRFFFPGSFNSSKDLFSFLPDKLKIALRFRLYNRKLTESATQSFVSFRHVLQKLAANNKYDFVICENLETLSLSRSIRKLFPNSIIIFDAHNIDHKLLKEGSLLYKKTLRKEATLWKFADRFWACSDDDRSMLESLNNHRIRGYTVPNGVSTLNEFILNKHSVYNNILFCGSLDYGPNIQGLIWFNRFVWPKVISSMLGAKLTIIGRGLGKGLEELKSVTSIYLIGEVADVAPYYRDNFIAIVPLLEGSGTRLKITEAMSYGNPVVSTSIGAEGIKIQQNVNVLIADTPEAFANSLLAILEKPEIGEQMRRNARELIDAKYNWDYIGLTIKESLLND
ncbi:glycosyltransferase family 4 protein [Pontibacter sp. H259]|uniref:glycosyltransferase family 4 protein n=1 Tax=Pontibacter sp. H259 TaxID=3133421 RepID=UPI0030BE9BC0